MPQPHQKWKSRPLPGMGPILAKILHQKRKPPWESRPLSQSEPRGKSIRSMSPQRRYLLPQEMEPIRSKIPYREQLSGSKEGPIRWMIPPSEEQ